MAPVANRWPLIAKAGSVHVTHEVDKEGLGGIFSDYFGFPLPVPFHHFSPNQVQLNVLLTRRTTAWEPSKKQRAFGNRRSLDGNVL
jgi:hypothetical protein